MLWNGKLIGKLLLIITMVDLKQFTFQVKPITYTKIFVKLYNWKNYRGIYKIYKIIEL